MNAGIRRFVVMVAALAPLSAMAAKAEMSIYDYLTLYGKASRVEHVNAIAIGLGWANTVLVHRGDAPLFCQPGALSLTPEQIVEMLDSYLGKHQPSNGDDPIGMHLLFAMQEAFPC